MLLQEGPDLETTDESITIHRPLGELCDRDRAALTEWLTQHGIDPAHVAVGAAIERDELGMSLVWREDTPAGRVLHHRFPAVESGQRWPAPFPEPLRAWGESA